MVDYVGNDVCHDGLVEGEEEDAGEDGGNWQNFSFVCNWDVLWGWVYLPASPHLHPPTGRGESVAGSLTVSAGRASGSEL